MIEWQPSYKENVPLDSNVLKSLVSSTEESLKSLEQRKLSISDSTPRAVVQAMETQINKEREKLMSYQEQLRHTKEMN